MSEQAVVEAMHAFYADPELPDFGNRAVALLATRLENKVHTLERPFVIARRRGGGVAVTWEGASKLLLNARRPVCVMLPGDVSEDRRQECHRAGDER